MIVAKQVADIITFLRGLLAVVLVWLGFLRGVEGLPFAAWAMILDWTGDALDGAIARRSRIQYRSWIGDHDLQVDMLVSAGLMVYMLLSGFVSLNTVVFYVLLWCLIFWRWGLEPALGMLFQAPIYAWFILVAASSAPHVGWMLVLWIVGAVIITWPKFPQAVIPGFIAGMQKAISNDLEEQNSGEKRGKAA